MCPQYLYHKAFISHSNQRSLPRDFFTKLSNLEIRTVKPNRFKCCDTLKLPAQNCNHQQGFTKQKTVALHH